MSDHYATTAEIADRLNVSAQTVINLARRGEIPHVRVGRQFRFNQAAVEAALQPAEPEVLTFSQVRELTRRKANERRREAAS